jgi:hypothetical protein
MLKKVVLAILLTASLLLAGCAADNSKGGAANQPKINADTVIIKTTNQMNKIKNMEMNMSMDIELAEGAQKSTQKMVSNAKFYRVQPFIYQTTRIENESGAGKNTMNLVQYVDDQAVYVKNSSGGQWAKVSFDNSTGKLLENSLKKQTNPSTQLELLKSFKKNMDLKKSGSNYVIRFGGNKKELRAFIQKAMLKNFNATKQQALQRSLDVMNFTSMKYTYVVDQKTYQPKSLNVSFTAKPKSDQGSGSLKMTVHSDFSKINQLKTMTIPADVKSKAIEIDASRLQGQF